MEKALVIIDIQNDITKNYKDIIDKINQAIDWAAAKGLPVIYIRHENLSSKTRTFKPGFANQSSLSRFFRKNTGLSPSEYRRSIHILRSFSESSLCPGLVDCAPISIISAPSFCICKAWLSAASGEFHLPPS